MNKSLSALLVVMALTWRTPAGAHADSGSLSLTLSEAIRLAVENNLDVRAELYTPAQFEAETNRNRAIYDPLLSAQTLFTDSTTGSAYKTAQSGQGNSGIDLSDPTISATGAGRNIVRSWELNSSLSQLFPSGATASLAFNNASLSNNSTVLLNDYWQSDLAVTLNQPLLKNFGRENTEAAINISRISKSASLERFTSRLLNTVAQVRQEYYNLYDQQEQLAVKKSSLELAQKILAETKSRVAAGVLPAMEISNAEFGVAGREKDLLDAERQVKDQEDTVRLLLQLSDQRELKPVDRPRLDPVPVNTDQAIKRALANPEIREQKKNLEISKLQTRIFGNNTKPDLSLAASNSLTGLDRRYQEDLEKVGAMTYPVWSVGLNFTYPLGNAAAENDYRKSQLKTTQTALQIRSLEENTINGVKAAIRGIETTYKQIEVAARGRAYAEERLQAYIRKNEVGLATIKDVLEVENDLATAKGNQIAAEVNYDHALTLLWGLTGELLERERIKVDETAADDLYRNSAR